MINPKTGRKGLTVDELVAATDKDAERWEAYGYNRNMSLEQKRAWIQDCLDELERYGFVSREEVQ